MSPWFYLLPAVVFAAPARLLAQIIIRLAR